MSDYHPVIVLHHESFALSQIHHACNETSTQVPEVGHGALASLATLSEQTYKLRDDLLAMSDERRHRRVRLTCIDAIAIDKVDMAGSVSSDCCSRRVYER